MKKYLVLISVTVFTLIMLPFTTVIVAAREIINTLTGIYHMWVDARGSDPRSYFFTQKGLTNWINQ